MKTNLQLIPKNTNDLIKWPTGCWSADSLTVIIPLDKTTIIDERLNSYKIVTYYNDNNEITGYDENETDIKNKSLRITSHYTSTRFQIHENYIIGSKKDQFGKTHIQRISVLKIMLNAKLAGEHYPFGITLISLRIIYEVLMKMEIAQFTWERFLNSQITDVDIKLDYYSTQEDRNNLIKRLMDLTPTSQQVDKGYSYSGNRPEKDIIQFGNRKGATPGKPFWKDYDKMKDFNKDDINIQHYNEVLNNYNLNELNRVEFTIKNKKHFESLDVEAPRLIDLINFSQETFNTMFLKILAKHLTSLKTNIMKKESEGLTPANQVHKNSIIMGLKHQPLSEVKFDMLKDLDRNNKSKYSKLIDDLYKNEIINTEPAQKWENLKKKMPHYGILFE